MRLRLSVLAIALASCGGPNEAGSPRAPTPRPDAAPTATLTPEGGATPLQETAGGDSDAGGAPGGTKVETVVSTGVSLPRFSTDGAHFLADVGLERGRSLVLDGREIFRGTQHIIHSAIAPDGSWVSFQSSEVLPQDEQKRTGKGTRDLLVHRGQTTPTDGEPAGIAVTADGAHLAYAVAFSLKDDSAVFLDGKRVGRGYAPRLLTISADGKRWAIANSVDRYGAGETVTVDGVKGPRHGAIWGLTFSPDSKHVAYKAVAHKGTASTVVVDGRASPRYTSVEDELAWTADSRIVARARSAGGPMLVVGSTEHATGHLRGVVVVENAVVWIDELIAGGRRTARAFVDGTEVYREDAGTVSPMGDYGPAISGLAVARGGKRIAFWTMKGVQVVDVGSGSGPKVIGDAGTPITFDADGKRLAVGIVSGRDGVGVDVVSVTGGPTMKGHRLPPTAKVHEQTVRFVKGAVRYFANRGMDLVRVEMPVSDGP